MMRGRESNMWLTRIYPELSRLSSGAERRDLVSQARKRLAVHWPRLCLAAVAIVLGVFSLLTLANAVRLPSVAVQLTATVPAILFGTCAIHVFWKRPMQLRIRRVLNERGIPVCLHCGYSLAGLPEPRCPECGEPFEPKGDAP